MDATAAIKIEQYRLRVRFRKLLTCCSDNCRDWWFNHAHHMAFHSLSLSHAVSSFTNAQRIYGNKKWYIWIFIWFLLLFNFSMNSPLHIHACELQLLRLAADFLWNLLSTPLDKSRLELSTIVPPLVCTSIESEIYWSRYWLNFIGIVCVVSSSHILSGLFSRCLLSHRFFTGISIAK